MQKFLLPALALLISYSAKSQQYVSSSPDSVCAGATNVVYRIPPASVNPGSTYNWSLTGGGTIVPQASSDSIYVNWPATTGTSQVHVSETTSGGCISEEAVIDVYRYTPSAVLSGAAVNLCAGVAGSASWTVNFSGRKPFSVTYTISNGSTTIGPFTESNIQTTSHQITANITQAQAIAGNYTVTITAASDKGACTLTDISGTSSLVIKRPEAPVASVNAQPTCTENTGSIEINSPTGAGLTYGNGGAYQASTTFANLSPGNYTFTTKDSDGCISVPSTSLTINPPPAAPETPTASAATQPDCDTPTGSITVSAPTGAGLTYSIGGAYQSSTSFTNVSPGTYNVTVRNSEGCTSAPGEDIVINPAPAAPAAPTASVTEQPDCATATGTIVVTAPVGSDITYSIGSAYQSSPTFRPLSPGTYTVTARNQAGCTSATSANLVINNQPPSPAAPIIQHID